MLITFSEKIKQFRHKFLVLIIIQAVILFGLIIVFLSKKMDADALNMGINIEDFSSNYITYEDGWSITPDDIEEESSIDLLYGPFISLPRGSYTLVVGYSCDNAQTVKPYSSSNDRSINANPVNLIPELHTVSYDFSVNEDLDDFEIRAYYDGEGVFTVSSVSLFKNLNPIKKTIFIFVLIFLLIDISIVNLDRIKTGKTEIICLAGVVFIASLPLFAPGTGYGIDTIFHLTRLEGLVNEIQMGHFPVRLQSVWVGVNGYPVSIYYGDALLYIAALLRFVGFSISAAYDSYVFIINILTVVIGYFSFKIIVKDRIISVIMTFAYTTEMYRILNMYFRDALGEYTAMTFLPMVAAALYLIYTDEEKEDRPDVNQAVLLGIAIAAIILSHTLSIEIVAFSLCLFCLLNLRKTFRVRTISTLLISGVISVLLSLTFLVPFIDYYKNVDVMITNGLGDTVHYIQSDGINLFRVFAFLQNRYKGWPTLTMGIPFTLILIPAIMMLRKGHSNRAMKISMIIGGIMFYLSTDLFPWDYLAYRCRLINIFASIQSPFRCLTIADVSFSVLLGLMLLETKGKECALWERKLATITIVLSIVGVSVFYGQYIDNAVMAKNIDMADIFSGSYDGVYFGGEYLRVRQDGEPSKYKQRGVEAINASVELLSEEGTTMSIVAQTESVPGTVHLPLTNYKGYEAIDSMGNTFEIYDDENCKVTFDIPINYNGTITVSFIEPWYWRASEIVSLLAWVVVLAYVLYQAIKKDFFIKGEK